MSFMVGPPCAPAVNGDKARMRARQDLSSKRASGTAAVGSLPCGVATVAPLGRTSVRY